jgi:D-amino peptidase
MMHENNEGVFMKVLIWDDIEGIAGVSDPNQGFSDGTYKQMITMEVNAAIRGLVKAGAREIDIFDGHGMGDNLLVEDLDSAANYLGGGWMTTLAGLIRTEKLGQYDALVLMGQHAQNGTVDGFLAHTNSSFTALRLNDQPIGEIGQAGWLAGHFGVPLLFVSGDDAAIREAVHFFPEIESVAVKRKEEGAFVCRPESDVYKETEEKASRALSKLKEYSPSICKGPITVEILFSLEELAEQLSIIPGYEKVGERTIVYHAEDYLEAFWAYHGFRPVLSSFIGKIFQNAYKKAIEEFNLDENETNRILSGIQDEMLEGRIAFPEIKF